MIFLLRIIMPMLAQSQMYMGVRPECICLIKMQISGSLQSSIHVYSRVKNWAVDAFTAFFPNPGTQREPAGALPGCGIIN